MRKNSYTLTPALHAFAGITYVPQENYTQGLFSLRQTDEHMDTVYGIQKHYCNACLNLYIRMPFM